MIHYMTHTKFFTARKQYLAGRKTPVYVIHSRKNGEVLGFVKYHPPWRKWVFKSEYDIIWDNDCLNDVLSIIGEATEEHQKHRKAEEVE